MLQLSGDILNVFVTDKGVTKDGREYGGDPVVQLMAEMPLENGGHKYVHLDLKIRDRSQFEGRTGERVTIPVGAFSPAKGQVVYFQSGNPNFSGSGGTPAKS